MRAEGPSADAGRRTFALSPRWLPIALGGGGALIALFSLLSSARPGVHPLEYELARTPWRLAVFAAVTLAVWLWQLYAVPRRVTVSFEGIEAQMRGQEQPVRLPADAGTRASYDPHALSAGAIVLSHELGGERSLVRLPVAAFRSRAEAASFVAALDGLHGLTRDTSLVRYRAGLREMGWQPRPWEEGVQEAPSEGASEVTDAAAPQVFPLARKSQVLQIALVLAVLLLFAVDTGSVAATLVVFMLCVIVLALVAVSARPGTLTLTAEGVDITGTAGLGEDEARHYPRDSRTHVRIRTTRAGRLLAFSREGRDVVSSRVRLMSVGSADEQYRLLCLLTAEQGWSVHRSVVREVERLRGALRAPSRGDGDEVA
jgi:hypothetical protein